MKTTKPNRPIRARYFPADHTDPIYWTAECLLAAPDAPPARIVEEAGRQLQEAKR